MQDRIDIEKDIWEDNIIHKYIVQNGGFDIEMEYTPKNYSLFRCQANNIGNEMYVLGRSMVSSVKWEKKERSFLKNLSL